MKLNYKKAVIVGAASLSAIFSVPHNTLADTTFLKAVNNIWVYIDN